MNKKLLLGAALFFTLNLCAQDLFVTKRDYSGATSIHSLLEINQTTGSLVSSYNYQTAFSSSYSPASLCYNSTSNEIFGISNNLIVKYNISTKSESYITLPTLGTSQDYGDIVIANNRLFVTRRDYSNSSTYIHSILEINQTNGNLISSYNYQTAFSSSYSPASLCFNTTSNEIFGVSENVIVKYNITTQSENSIILPTLTSSQDYGDIVIANNRLFVTRRDYTNSSTNIYSIQEINQTNGNLISSYDYQTAFSSSYPPESLCYNSATNEIFGVRDNIVVKYNITTQGESYITLPTLGSGQDYGEIVSTSTSTSGINDAKINSEDYSDPVSAYNLHGQKVPLNTLNEPIIIEYKNGQAKKSLKSDK